MESNRWRAMGMLWLWVGSAALGGCSGSLEGDWTGGLDCGAWGTVGMNFSLTPDGTAFSGTGEFTDIQLNDIPATIHFDVALEKTSASGEQPVDIDLSGCALATDDGEERDIRCDEPSDSAWDGHDVITGQVPSFLEGYTDEGVSCVMGLERE